MSEEVKTHKGILNFKDIFGVTQKQIRMAQRREVREKAKEKKEEGTWERME